MRHEIVAPTDCTIVEIRPEPGDSVPSGATIAIVEMMKIERLVEAPAEGVITEVRVSAGEVVKAGQVWRSWRSSRLRDLTADDPDDGAAGERADLAEYHARRALLDDEARPEAIARSTLAGVEPPVRTWQTLSTQAAFRSTAASCTPPRRAVEMSTT